MDSTLLYALYGCIAAIVVCWALGTITREYSWVDRLWSILPPLYVAWFGYSAGFESPRAVLMTVLVAGWGARLTFNFARKGGYAPGGEDYRWPVLRARWPRWLWEIFSLLFIAGFQDLLVLGITLPAWFALFTPGARPLGGLDAVATLLFVTFQVFETIADQQQWEFHQDKKARHARGEAAEPFLQRGLWAYSRHPNFFCEQATWWSLYLFSVAATGEWLNWTVIGAVTLTVLFQGSTAFTEELSAAKYPTYTDYQRRTSRLVPWFRGRQ